MMYVKFKQSTGDVTEDKEYKVTRTYEEDGVLFYYFKDNVDDEAVIRKVVGTDTDNFFEVISGESE